MDADQALADLMEISSQVETAVIFDEGGKIAGSTVADAARAQELARRADELLQHAASLRGGETAPTQLEVATSEGSVFVAVDRKTRIVATTGPQPTVGLVFYDLKSALRQIEQKPPGPKRRRAPAKPAAAAENAAPKETKTPKKQPAAPKKPAARKKTDEA